jgi:hypothetical protein
LEYLGVGVGPVHRHGDHVQGADGLVRDPLALEQRVHRAQPVAEGGRPFELLLRRGFLHALLELALDGAVTT